MAMMAWVPSETAVLFQVTPYGAEISSAPMFVLVSSLNWTPVTLTSSVALAETVTEVPVTVALLLGAVTFTVGEVVSAAIVNEIV
jgi:hypothetical protein